MTSSSTQSNATNSVIRVKAIDHVTIVVEDLARSRDFYRDLLGMVEVDRPDGCMQLWFYDPDGHCVEVFDRTGDTPGTRWQR
ncbi:Glyoxalase/Bleomycin resistance protein/Dioxygenase superfamily protein [Stieleria neptunia]|uniref:Glyoxalase/Bleomycin resistance protein/Dioxygenase superfamily protein n=1 Tax=Stieleria neptunia TaxID=2527979 RepID=A0A518HY49_9BACT|nr:VOC family protein [Stieleria neptunia]QDV45684.1 Glyoxalase/Bleomycin resistance protein/Dioxygenase superfamily protein [Stieleria neptunia]